MNRKYQRYLVVNTAHDQTLDTGVVRAADKALESVDAETIQLFQKYHLKIPGDYSVMSWKRFET